MGRIPKEITAKQITAILMFLASCGLVGTGVAIGVILSAISMTC